MRAARWKIVSGEHDNAVARDVGVAKVADDAVDGLIGERHQIGDKHLDLSGTEGRDRARNR